MSAGVAAVAAGLRRNVSLTRLRLCFQQQDLVRVMQQGGVGTAPLQVWPHVLASPAV